MSKFASGLINLTKDDPYITISVNNGYNKDWWSCGSDNLFPYAIARLNRKSTIHRGILNYKTAYIIGKGFQTSDKNLKDYLKNVNNADEDLRTVIRKVLFDKLSSGNGYLEIVTNTDSNL